MLKDLRFLLGKDIKLLRKPIILLVSDSLFNMLSYGMLYFVLLDLVNQVFTMEKLKTYLIIMTVAFVLRIFLNRIAYTLIQTQGARAIQTLRIKLGNHIRSLNLGYFNKRSIGDITSTMIQDLSDLEKVLTHSLSDLIKTVVLSVYFILLTFAIDRTMAIIQLSFVLVAMPIMYFGGQYVKKVGEHKKIAIQNMVSRIVEFMNGMQLLKSYNMAGEKFDRLKQSLLDFKKESIRTEVSIVPFVLLFQLIVDISFPVLLIVGVTRFTGGAIDARSLITFVILNIALCNIIRAFAAQYGEFRYMRLALSKLVKVYKLQPMVYDMEDLDVKEGRIAFQDVSFAYEDELVLRDVTFESTPGTVTALIGPSGAGKTTIMSLIARFFDVKSGKITIDGVDIKKVHPDALLSHIAMVFQEAYLLNDTVLNNLKVGSETATHDEIIEACKRANCYDFIMDMPDGFETIVGEGGATLSGGEKQRIAIARALLKDAKIILLDEATASLDADNEYEVRQAIKALTQDKTVIVIAHRLHTITDADQIIVMNKGQIEEKASHESLMFKRGHYYQMIQSLENAREWQLV